MNYELGAPKVEGVYELLTPDSYQVLQDLQACASEVEGFSPAPLGYAADPTYARHASDYHETVIPHIQPFSHTEQKQLRRSGVTVPALQQALHERDDDWVVGPRTYLVSGQTVENLNPPDGPVVLVHPVQQGPGRPQQRKAVQGAVKVATDHDVHWGAFRRPDLVIGRIDPRTPDALPQVAEALHDFRGELVVEKTVFTKGELLAGPAELAGWLALQGVAAPQRVAQSGALRPKDKRLLEAVGSAGGPVDEYWVARNVFGFDYDTARDTMVRLAAHGHLQPSE